LPSVVFYEENDLFLSVSVLEQPMCSVRQVVPHK